MEIQSLNHSTWVCNYHVVWIPKYRQKKIFQIKDVTVTDKRICFDIPEVEPGTFGLQEYGRTGKHWKNWMMAG